MCSSSLVSCPESFCIVYIFYNYRSAPTCASTNTKRTKKLPDFSDADMDFEPSNSKSQSAVNSGSEELDSFNYAQPDPKYMGKKLR